MKEWEKIIEKISTVSVQGASNVAKAMLDACVSFLSETEWNSEDDMKKDFGEFLAALATVRQTEPLSRNVAAYLLWKMDIAEKMSVPELRVCLGAEIEIFKSRFLDVRDEITKNGSALISDGFRVMTHCHSGGVERVFSAAHKKGILFEVYLTETRPLLQGHITAESLQKQGIRVTLMPDSAASSVLAGEGEVKIDKVFLGCDAIAKDGSAANKIGSYGIALSAYKQKIPVYIVGTLLKLDPLAKKGENIYIEKRDSSEVWENAPSGVNILNAAFDVIPAELITGFVTEAGIIKPKNVSSRTISLYPWVRTNNSYLKNIHNLIEGK